MSSKHENTDLIYCASFDIGKKNFAFTIECFSKKELEDVREYNIEKSKRYNPNGTSTPEMEEILNKVYENGKVILQKNLNLTKGCDSKKRLDVLSLHNMIEELDIFDSYFKKCTYIIIEKQMNFGKARNPMAMKLADHCFSYFIFRYGKVPVITEFDSFHKTQVLGAEKKLTYTKKGKAKYGSVDPKKRKNWAVEKALEIFESREEDNIIESINKMKKKDDVCDTFLQLQAFKYLYFVDGAIF